MQPGTQLDKLLKPRHFTATILWLALTMSMVIYVAVGFVISGQGEPTPPTEQVLRLPLYIVAALTGLAGIGMRLFLFSDDRIAKRLESTPDINALATVSPGTPPDQTRLEALNRLSEKELKLLGLTGAFVTPFILVMAMNEAVVIYGLVLTIMYHQSDLIVPFAAAGILLNLTMVRTIPSLVERGSRILR